MLPELPAKAAGEAAGVRSALATGGGLMGDRINPLVEALNSLSMAQLVGVQNAVRRAIRRRERVMKESRKTADLSKEISDHVEWEPAERDFEREAEEQGYRLAKPGEPHNQIGFRHNGVTVFVRVAKVNSPPKSPKNWAAAILNGQGDP